MSFDTPYLDPRLPALWRTPGTLQVGLDPARAVALCGASRELPGLLARLDGTPTTGVQALARRQDRLDELTRAVALLAASGLVREADPRLRREQSWVEVVGDGPLAVAVAAGLRQSGVGRCSRATQPTVPGPDLVVVAPACARAMAFSDPLVASGTPHLWSYVRDGRAVVGPLVIPGETSCLRCHDLHRTDSDPAWPQLVLAWEQSRPPRASAATEALLGALVVRQCVIRVQDGRPATLGATLEEQADGVMDRRRWPAHPACGCCWSGAPRSSTPAVE